jgi:hypothetical protein
MQKYTPIFFSKDDLDVALNGAYKNRKDAQAAEYVEQARKHKADYEAATQEVQDFQHRSCIA